MTGGRLVTLVLVDAAGTPLGALPPLPVPEPHWPEAGPVVDAARQRHGVDITLLRLLAADGEAVTYLAELPGGATRPDTPTGLSPVDGVFADDPLRAPWARPGGPAAS
ncbi:MAG: aminoglycoside phosphotransferase family protein, partial [Micromonosporaceae bacterium]|nr:aminoglycoside phosphotransferase family protein [Micromonosporaceae bacterium]